MSVFQTFTLPCPRCGTPAPYNLALSINAPRVPAVRQAILEDRFQRLCCAACGEAFTADGPLVYIDFEERQWIGVYPRGEERRHRELTLLTEERFHRGLRVDAPPMAAALAVGMRVRTVFGLTALRDKLWCFALGLPDDALEVLKLEVMRDLVGLSARLWLCGQQGPDLLFTCDRRTEQILAPRQRLVEIDRDRGPLAAVYQAVTGGSYVSVGQLLP